MNSLAERLRSNWMNKLQQVKETDDSLTNLNWLYDTTPLSNDNDVIVQTDEKKPLSLIQTSLQGSVPNTSNQPYAGSLFDPQVRYEYRTKWTGKPPFSYATLICLAMRELGKPKVTLSDIYGWIMTNFAYYRHTDSSWQNSVRHNLSLNKCFEKVPRDKGERGKGGFWRVNPKHSDFWEANLIKCRRPAPPPGPAPPIPRAMLMQQQQQQQQSLSNEAPHSPLISTSLYSNCGLQTPNVHNDETVEAFNGTSRLSSESHLVDFHKLGGVGQDNLHPFNLQNDTIYMAGHYGGSSQNTPQRRRKTPPTSLRRSFSSSSPTRLTDEEIDHLGEGIDLISNIKQDDEDFEEMDDLPVERRSNEDSVTSVMTQEINVASLNKRKRGAFKNMCRQYASRGNDIVMFDSTCCKDRVSRRPRRPAGSYLKMNEGCLSSDEDEIDDEEEVTGVHVDTVLSEKDNIDLSHVDSIIKQEQLVNSDLQKCKKSMTVCKSRPRNSLEQPLHISSKTNEDNYGVDEGPIWPSQFDSSNNQLNRNGLLQTRQSSKSINSELHNTSFHLQRKPFDSFAKTPSFISSAYGNQPHRVSSSGSTCSGASNCSSSSSSAAWQSADNQLFRTTDCRRRVDTQVRVYPRNHLGNLTPNQPAASTFSRLYPTTLEAQACMSASPSEIGGRLLNTLQAAKSPSCSVNVDHVAVPIDDVRSSGVPQWASVFLPEETDSQRALCHTASTTSDVDLFDGYLADEDNGRLVINTAAAGGISNNMNTNATTDSGLDSSTAPHSAEDCSDEVPFTAPPTTGVQAELDLDFDLVSNSLHGLVEEDIDFGLASTNVGGSSIKVQHLQSEWLTN